MNQEHKIQVGLDKPLIESLLGGLYHGAERKILKVIIGADKKIYVESKDLRIVLEIDDTVGTLKNMRLSNEKLFAVVSRADLEQQSLAAAADRAVNALKKQYNPMAHSLADNIYVFGRSYGSEFNR